jgi:hypothetical protein
MPKRIQRRRTKGWRLPEGAVCVTRPGKWGNPFTVMPNARPGAKVGGALGYQAVPTVEDAIECYRAMFDAKPGMVKVAQEELRGKDLACFCHLCEKHKDGKPMGVECSDCAPCHVDTLLEIVNA